MPWMKAEAQFPTPINATFTLGICGTLLGFSICECDYKKLRCQSDYIEKLSADLFGFFSQVHKKRLLNDAD